MPTGSKWDDLPGWAKGVVVVLAAGASVAIVGGAVWGVNKLITRSRESKDPKKTVEAAEAEINAIKNDPTKPAFYGASTYQGWANSIAQMVQGCDMNKNDMAIWNIMTQIHTDRDYLELVKAFGVRTIDNCGIGTGSYMADLHTVLEQELTDNTINGINRVFAAGKMKSRI